MLECDVMHLVEVCLLSHNLETDWVTPLFHCWYVYYLEVADSVAQPFLYGATTPHYVLDWTTFQTEAIEANEKNKYDVEYTFLKVLQLSN
jgi:hypothetical protein